jgi:hypothetical protein
MKKIFVSIVLMLTMVVALTGCASDEQGPSGTAAEIADKIFAEAGAEPFGPARGIGSDDDMRFLLGSTEYPEFADFAGVIPMISLDTRVLHVIKATNVDEVEDIKIALEKNIDPAHLICVTFALEDVVIESRGDVVFMTINSDHEQRDALADAFQVVN